DEIEARLKRAALAEIRRQFKHLGPRGSRHARRAVARRIVDYEHPVDGLHRAGGPDRRLDPVGLVVCRDECDDGHLGLLPRRMRPMNRSVTVASSGTLSAPIAAYAEITPVTPASSSWMMKPPESD